MEKAGKTSGLYTFVITKIKFDAYLFAIFSIVSMLEKGQLSVNIHCSNLQLTARYRLCIDPLMVGKKITARRRLDKDLLVTKPTFFDLEKHQLVGRMSLTIKKNSQLMLIARVWIFVHYKS